MFFFNFFFKVFIVNNMTTTYEVHKYLLNYIMVWLEVKIGHWVYISNVVDESIDELRRYVSDRGRKWLVFDAQGE